MPLVNLFLFVVLGLVALIGILLICEHNESEEKARRDLAQLRKEASYERKISSQKSQDFFKVGRE